MPTLLVIDRNRRSLPWLCRSLAPQGRIVGVPNVFTGLRLLRRRRFDAIVVKSAQDDAYAIAVLKWLAKRNVECPVVVVLTSGAAADATLAREYGARAILRWRPSVHGLVHSVSAAIAVPLSNIERRQNGAGAKVAPAGPTFRDDHARQWFRNKHRALRSG